MVVTTHPSIFVLSILSEEEISPFAVTRSSREEQDKISYRAAQRGTAVHELVEKYMDIDPDYKKGYMPNIHADFMSIKPILDSRIEKVYAQKFRCIRTT